MFVRLDDIASGIVNVDHTGAALPTSVTSNADKVWVVSILLRPLRVRARTRERRNRDQLAGP